MSMNRLSLGLASLLIPSCVAPGGAELGAIDQPIVGGQTATTAEFPSVVALENAPGDWFCTGTLIDKNWVLTAAHCMEGETAATLKIRLDDDNINDATGGTVVAVAEIHSHPDFNFDAWDNDIALIKLATSVTDREPTPINRTAVAFATAAIEVGYGDADNNGGGAGLLRKLTASTIDCAGANDPGITNDNLLCFDATGMGSCYGDSGGPAFVTVNGKLAVAGITSGGSGAQCAAGFDLDTSVAGELAFVDSVMLGAPNPDPDPNPNPNPDPNPDPNDPGTDTTDGGGCSTGHGHGGLLVFAAAALVACRRRRRR